MKLIPRDAVLAEIDKRIDTCLNQREEMIIADCETLVGDATARAGELQCLRDSIESLEVKEVDLDKELDLVEDKYRGFESLSRADVIAVAKHFFEFGLKTQKEEPVSEDLVAEIRIYKERYGSQATFVDCAKHFAQWQKQKMIEKFTKWCQEEFFVQSHDDHVVQYVSDKIMWKIEDFVEEFKNKMEE